MATTGDLNRKSGWHCPYGKCEGNGFLYDEETNSATDCPCRPQMIAYTRASRLRARIPKRYAGVDFDQPPVTDMPPAVVRGVRRYVDQLSARLEEGRGLWFEGPQGTGKTTLAMLVSKRALAAGRSVAIYSVPRILAEMRDTFDDDAEFGSTELIDRLTEVELLQLDDLGAERTSPWVLEQLYSVINARYEAERSVLVTTNLGRDELIEQVGARTVSRLTEMCDVIPLYGDDHRLTASMGGLGGGAGAGAGGASTPSAPAFPPPATREEATGWHSPAGAANLQRPSWSDHASPAAPEDAEPRAVPAGPSPPSWWDRRDPWPPTPGDGSGH